jgi:hypothetical protein
MATGLVLKETMSGWMQLDDDTSPRDFSFSLQAFTSHIFSLSTPRSFRGQVTLDGDTLPCHGELTILPSGPHYWLDVQHPQLGNLHIEGKKNYELKNLVRSLTTCPLTVYRDGRHIGRAEVAYRDSMLAFPFKALRLVREDRAFGEFGGQS